MNIDGTGVKQLTTTFSAYPAVTPDGKWVVFVGSTDNGTPAISRVPIDGGDPVRTDESGYRMSVSPIDGSIAAEVAGRGDNVLRRDLVVLPLSGGPASSPITLPTTIGLYDRVTFTPDGKSLAYIDTRNDSANIWTIPLSGKPEPRQFTTFTDQRIFGFAWSAGGHKLVTIRGNEIQDAVLLSDSRQQ
jgi:Tol biopolymer transport system component